jgi:hypothetical protein
VTKPDPAAARRAAYVAALREEREQLAAYGQTDRVADVDAEIAYVTGEPVGRSETPVQPAPPRRTTKPKE